MCTVTSSKMRVGAVATTILNTSQVFARTEQVKSSWDDRERLQREREGKIRRAQLLGWIMAAKKEEDSFCGSRETAAA